MKIQSILKCGIVAGFMAYGIKACEDIDNHMSEGLVSAKENSKTFIKFYSPQKFDSLSNLKNADAKVWFDAENQILDSLNRNCIYNKALLNLKSAAKDTAKIIK